MTNLLKAALDKIDRKMTLELKALEIFDYVVSEWNSDPTSTQCFDYRIIENAKKISEELKSLV